MSAAPARPIRRTVGPEDAGRPLLELVAAALGDRAIAGRLMARGGLWMDGARVRDGAALAPLGSLLVIQPPPDGRYRDPLVEPGMVLYEDAALIALHKPPDTYVDEAPWDAEGNLLVALARFLAARDGAAPRLHAAHRLDRDTSGVLLISKDPAVNASLQRAFAGGQVHKAYLALCAGEPPADAWTIETGHGRSAHGRFRVYPREEVGRALPDGSRVKLMRTRFEVLRRLGDAALLRAVPETGRTHQIRLHLAHTGHPLIGDLKYGGPGAWRGKHCPFHLLHAARLELPHPHSGRLVVEAPPPPWAAACDR
jgi:23S rRNA pseudouridine1911/1915/1917 synthase